MSVSQKVHIDTYDYGATLPVPTVNEVVDNTLVATAASCGELVADGGIYIAEFVGASEANLIPAGTYRLRTSSGGLPIKFFVTFAGVDGELVFARAEYAVGLPPATTSQLAGISTILARLGGWTGTGINTVLGAFRALAAKAANLTPTDISTGTTYNNVAHSQEAIAEGVDDVAPLGPGEDQVTIEIIDDGSGVDDVSVWITSDAGGSAVVAGSSVTNGSGRVTFLLTAGTSYYLWASKTGKISIQGRLFVAVAD